MNTSTVCITGASRGLGFALVQAFLERPSCHVLAVSRNVKTLEPLVLRHPGRLHLAQSDICSSAGRSDVALKLADLPELGVLIHNAATLIQAPFPEIREQELRTLYEVNVFAPFLLTQALFSIMRRTHVINISSVGGVQGSLKFAGLSAYSSSKAALNCLTEMWAEEFKDTDIAFNCLALGSVETEMFRTAFPGFQAASTPEEMASYIAHFAFEAPKVTRGKIFSLSMGNP